MATREEFFWPYQRKLSGRLQGVSHGRQQSATVDLDPEDVPQQVDEVALRIAALDPDDRVGGRAEYLAAWEAWGAWANGGFEGIFDNPTANDVPSFVAGLDEVGAPDQADLLRQAAENLPFQTITFDACREFFGRGDTAAELVLRAFRDLDRRMASLEPIKVVLARFLQSHPHLREV